MQQQQQQQEEKRRNLHYNRLLLLLLLFLYAAIREREREGGTGHHPPTLFSIDSSLSLSLLFSRSALLISCVCTVYTTVKTHLVSLLVIVEHTHTHTGAILSPHASSSSFLLLHRVSVIIIKTPPPPPPHQIDDGARHRNPRRFFVSCNRCGSGAASVVRPYQFRLSGEAPAYSTVNVASSAT